MPTPAGKPKVGEHILKENGSVLGKVTRRSEGDGYTVWIRKPGASRDTIITEFEWWMQHNRWKIGP